MSSAADFTGSARAELLLCPSARPATTSRLLGVRRADGRVGFVSPPLPITEAFLERAGSHPDARFRFVAPCVTDRCGQWTGSACGVGSLVAFHGVRHHDPEDPDCDVRPQCRWFAQEGSSACRGCQHVFRSDPEQRPTAPVRGS